MTALVKNMPLVEALSAATPVTAGFGPLAAPATQPGDSLRRAVVTMLLVLYPAMASAAAVIAALIYSGAHPVV